MTSALFLISPTNTSSQMTSIYIPQLGESQNTTPPPQPSTHPEPTKMTYSILIFAYRKPGTTPEQFRTHYEDSHVPLVKEIAGEHFPLSHTRRYLHRTQGKAEGTERNAEYPATVLVGAQAEFDYDAFAELTFSDAAAFQAFFGVVQQPENQARIKEDEAKFLDGARMTVVVVGEMTVTTK